MENEMKQIMCGLVVIFLALMLVGCAAQAGAQSAAQQTATVQRGDLTATLSAAGTAEAQAQMTLTFQTSGQIKAINVKTGDSVRAGQVLAQLDSTALEMAVAKAQVTLETSKVSLEQTKEGPTAAEVQSAKASLASAQAAYQAALDKYNLSDAQLAVARAEVDKAKATLQRAQLAYDWEKNNWLDADPTQSAQKESLDDAQSAYDLAVLSYNQTAAGINDSALQSAASAVAEAQYKLDDLLNTPTPEDIAAAEAQVKQDEASLQQAQLQLAQASIVAPFDGIIADVYAQVGQRASTSTDVVALADLSRLNLAVTLAEVDMPKVEAGQQAEITFDAVSSQVFTGTVTEIDLVGTTTSGVVNYAATVSIDNPTDALRPGMNASANIILQQRENVLLVPNRAVRSVGNAKMVTVVNGEQSSQVSVTLGLSGDTKSEVVDGLHEGDVVVINQTTTTSGSK
jgi:HlyD family secretion protein